MICGTPSLVCLYCGFVFAARDLNSAGLCLGCRPTAEAAVEIIAARAELARRERLLLVRCDGCGGIFDLALTWIQQHGTVCRKCVEGRKASQ
jgi:hypothetical protein